MSLVPEQPLNSEAAIAEAERWFSLSDDARSEELRLQAAARGSARAIASSHDHLVNSILKKIGRLHYTPQLQETLLPGLRINQTIGHLKATILDTRLPTQIGEGSILFMYEDHRRSDMAQFLGIKSDHLLRLGIQDDPNSLVDALNYIHDDPERNYEFFSYYYFDNDGNCAKALSLPAEFKDSRPSLIIPDMAVKWVRSAMTNQDMHTCVAATRILFEHLY